MCGLRLKVNGGATNVSGNANWNVSDRVNCEALATQNVVTMNVNVNDVTRGTLIGVTMTSNANVGVLGDVGLRDLSHMYVYWILSLCRGESGHPQTRTYPTHSYHPLDYEETEASY